MACGAAEDLEGAGDLGLGADDGTHEGGFAAAGGAEEAGDPAGFDGEVEAPQDRAAASLDGEATGLDGDARRIHHVMNILSEGRRRQGTGRGRLCSAHGRVQLHDVRLLHRAVREFSQEQGSLLGEEVPGRLVLDGQERGVAAEVVDVGGEGDAPGPRDAAVREVELGRQVAVLGGRAPGAQVFRANAEEPDEPFLLGGEPRDRVVGDVPPEGERAAGAQDAPDLGAGCGRGRSSARTGRT